MRTIVAVEIALSTSFCAVAAFIRVEPAIGSAPVASTIARSAAAAAGEAYALTIAMVNAPSARAVASAATTNGAPPLAEMPMTASPGYHFAHQPLAGERVVFGAFDRALERAGSAGDVRAYRSRLDAERRDPLGRIEKAKPAAGARADVVQRPAASMRSTIASTAAAIAAVWAAAASSAPPSLGDQELDERRRRELVESARRVAASLGFRELHGVRVAAPASRTSPRTRQEPVEVVRGDRAEQGGCARAGDLRQSGRPPAQQFVAEHREGDRLLRVGVDSVRRRLVVTARGATAARRASISATIARSAARDDQFRVDRRPRGDGAAAIARTVTASKVAQPSSMDSASRRGRVPVEKAVAERFAAGRFRRREREIRIGEHRRRRSPRTRPPSRGYARRRDRTARARSCGAARNASSSMFAGPVSHATHAGRRGARRASKVTFAIPPRFSATR